jgi:hypothetical protein
MPVRGPLLLYRDSCAKCRFLSRLAVAVSLGAIERVPASSAVAGAITQQVPAAQGKLVLLDGARLVIGRRVFAAVPWCRLRRMMGHGVH